MKKKKDSEKINAALEVLGDMGCEEMYRLHKKLWHQLPRTDEGWDAWTEYEQVKFRIDEAKDALYGR